VTGGSSLAQMPAPAPDRPAALGTGPQRAGRDPVALSTAACYALFLVLFLAIVAVIWGSGTLLIAPPYAVTAYLVVFDRKSRYAAPSSILASYLVVIGSSELFEFFLGISLLALVLNVVLVSLFIAFTRFSHPPALALTIFSYIVHDSPVFVLSSLVVLAMVTVADTLIERTWPTRSTSPGST